MMGDKKLPFAQDPGSTIQFASYLAVRMEDKAWQRLAC